MKSLMFTYPHGGGGSWLSNLIYRLENNITDVNKVDIVFDFTKKSSIRFGHKLEYYNPGNATIFDFPEFDEIVFCSNHPFNLYLNEANKVQLHLLEADKENFNIQFEILTSSAKGQITDENFKKYYYDSVGLDSSCVFTDPEKFIDRLFSILDQYNVLYTKNCDICYDSIEKYKSTCLDPDKVIGDMSSIFWLSWCHALKMIYKINLPESFDFTQAQDIKSVATALFPIQDQCKQLTKQFYYSWN